MYLSATMLTTFALCPRKARFRYVDKLQPEHTATALVLGGAVHAGIEHFHGDRMAGRAADIDLALRVFRADLNAQLEASNVRFKADETPADLTEMGEALVRAYVERYHDIAPVGAEVAFDVPLADPSTGEVVSEHRLRGFLDLVMPDDRIVEIKTAAKRPDVVDLDRRIQLSAYAYAYRLHHRRDPALVVTTLVKSKPGVSVEETATRRSVGDDAFFVEAAITVAKAFEAGVFPPSVGWQCEQCDFASACRSVRTGRTVPVPVATFENEDQRARAAG